MSTIQSNGNIKGKRKEDGGICRKGDKMTGKLYMVIGTGATGTKEDFIEAISFDEIEFEGCQDAEQVFGKYLSDGRIEAMESWKDLDGGTFVCDGTDGERWGEVVETDSGSYIRNHGYQGDGSLDTCGVDADELIPVYNYDED
jgi:hypothetical protein